MAIVKEKMKEVIDLQPDDATYEEILRELAFERMVERGLVDSREGHVISNDGAPYPLMADIRWTVEAETWLKDIYDYIARDNPRAAARVVEGIHERAQLLRTHPKIGYGYRSEPEGEIRILLYGHYRIAYLLAGNKAIDILGVFHGALDIERYLP